MLLRIKKYIFNTILLLFFSPSASRPPTRSFSFPLKSPQLTKGVFSAISSAFLLGRCGMSF